MRDLNAKMKDKTPTNTIAIDRCVEYVRSWPTRLGSALFIPSLEMKDVEQIMANALSRFAGMSQASWTDCCNLLLALRR